MQCTAALQCQKVAVAKPQTRTTAARVVVCRAQQQSFAAKAAAAGVSVPALLAAHPALALVDDRLATEGTGRILGISDPSLFWVILGVFSAVWALYYVSTKDVDTSENDDDYGLKL